MRIRIELRSDLVELGDVTAIVDATLARIAVRLCLADTPAVDGLVIGAGTSGVAHGRIHVAPRTGGGLTTLEWFELVFAHEYAHLALEHAWARGPALWWEGVPVHLGDDHVRTRVLGHSVHAYGRALAEHGWLRPLATLVSARGYYTARRDPRVDIQAGSFCGFVLACFGTSALRDFMRGYEPPSEVQPRVALDPLLVRSFGAPLAELEVRWRGFLASHAYEPALAERVRPREVALRAPHCERCFAPLAGARCDACGAPEMLEVVA